MFENVAKSSKELLKLSRTDSKKVYACLHLKQPYCSEENLIRKMFYFQMDHMTLLLEREREIALEVLARKASVESDSGGLWCLPML